MPFKLSLVADVAAWLKGTADVQKSLEEVADSLDELAQDSETNARQAADALETKFTSAFDEVKTQARTAARKIGDDLNDGTRRAGQGLDTFRDEGRQSIRETAASFSDVTDGLDLVQEVAANAFTGFGPAGLAAGAAAAIGIGAVTTALGAAQEAEEEARKKAIELGKAFGDAKTQAEGMAEAVKDSMSEDATSKPWNAFFQGNIDRITLWQKAVDQLGVSQADVIAAAEGDLAAFERIAAASTKAIDGSFELTATFKNDLAQQGESYRAAGTWAKQYAEWQKAAGVETADAGGKAKSAAGQTEQLTEAQQRAAAASQTFRDSLTGNFSVADEGLEKFVKKGKLNLQAWADELKSRSKENKLVREFAVDVEPKLTPKALQNFETLSAETQQQIAKAYESGSKKDRKKIIANLEAEAKISKFTLDTSGAQTEADANPIEVPTAVDTSGAVKGTKTAADAAQREANKTSNEIELSTRIDASGLQAQVNRAAAGIRPPTIYVTVKARKEVP